ncbi:MAG: NADH:flavin oxidoreductase [Sandaracinaceae bacterium]
MADLFAPLTFPSGATLSNRLALAPLTNQQSEEDGTASEAEMRFLERRAAGGFGLVSTCATHVAPEGKAFDGQLGIFDDRLLPGLGALAARIASHGALPVAQLHHGGARSPSRLIGRVPVSASAFTEDRRGFEPPRAATADEVLGFVRAFREAADRAARAGFGGVELHAAHGYLLGQFLSTTQNLREDEWGGDLDGRARLLMETLREVREAVPAGFVVGVRLSPENFGWATGLDLDESIEVARRVAAAGADYVHLSLWDFRKPASKRDVMPLPLFRDAIAAEVPILAAGKVFSRDDAEALRDQGADVVSIGRAAILDPDWPTHVREGAPPVRGPRTPAELHAVAVSPAFVEYLRRFDGMVSDP